MKIKDFWGFDQEFDQLANYLDLTKSALEENLKRFLIWADEKIKGLSDEEKDDFKIFYEDDYNEVARDFPKLLYSSFVVTWYSFVEHQLIEICRKWNLQISISIDDNERQGEGVSRVYNFLLKGLNYRIDNRDWQELKRIGKLRNQIVHNNGKILSSNENDSADSQKITKARVNADRDVYLLIESDLYNYLEENKIIELKDSFCVNPNHKYCRYLIDFGKSMLNKIDRDLSLLAVEEFSKKSEDHKGREDSNNDWLPT